MSAKFTSDLLTQNLSDASQSADLLAKLRHVSGLEFEDRRTSSAEETPIDHVDQLAVGTVFLRAVNVLIDGGTFPFSAQFCRCRSCACGPAMMLATQA